MMTPGMLDSMKSEQRMHTAQQSSAEMCLVGEGSVRHEQYDSYSLSDSGVKYR
jgi:hypothetical protein